jgi:hypothetical protein
MIRSGAVAKWNTPWMLADVRPVDPPAPYRHKPGAVTWVQLDDDVTATLAERLGSGVDAAPARSETAPSVPRSSRPAAAAPLPPRKAEAGTFAPHASKAQTGHVGAAGGNRLLGETTLTEGNIGNNHFYMRTFVHRFPSDLIGGSNTSEAAPRMALVDWGGPAPVETDIDGKKQFFRKRGWIRAFFEANGATAGDDVRVEETAPYRYRVTLKKAAP